MKSKSSWYGGACDPGDNNIPAWLPQDHNRTPGVALYRYDLKNKPGYLTAPNGHTVKVRVTDFGPAPWTGRKLDVNHTAARELGYRIPKKKFGCRWPQDNFPTDRGTFKLRIPVGVHASAAKKGCNTSSCKQRVVRKHMREVIRPYRAWLASTRACESGGNYRSRGNFYGAYQFDYGTWHEVGGRGTADQASPLEQDYRAVLLLKKAGNGRWPNCG